MKPQLLPLSSGSLCPARPKTPPPSPAFLTATVLNPLLPPSVPAGQMCHVTWGSPRKG